MSELQLALVAVEPAPGSLTPPTSSTSSRTPRRTAPSLPSPPPSPTGLEERNLFAEAQRIGAYGRHLATAGGQRASGGAGHRAAYFTHLEQGRR